MPYFCLYVVAAHWAAAALCVCVVGLGVPVLSQVRMRAVGVGLVVKGYVLVVGVWRCQLSVLWAVMVGL